MKNPRNAIFVFIAVLIYHSGKVTSSQKRQKLRCRYDKDNAEWQHCDMYLHLQIKEAKLIRGHNKCPATRTYTRPCDKGSIILNGCRYIQVSDWSDCDNSTKTTTRTLELKSGDTQRCDNNVLESRVCHLKKNVARKRNGSSNFNNDTELKRKRKQNKKKKSRKSRRGRRRRRRNRWRKQRNKAALTNNPDCIYKRAIWGNCDLRTGLQTAVQELRMALNSATCEKTNVITLPCGKKKSKKRGRNRDNVERQKKWKDRTKEKRKDKSKNNEKDEISHEPPRMTELYVVPYSTFVVVSWLPPQQDEGELPVDGYQIGYGINYPDVHVFQVNASEVTWKISKLKPGYQYIISIRAFNQMGVGQALYETVMTRAQDDSLPNIMPPRGVRALVLSSDRANVTWIDMPRGKDDPDQTAEYFLRYRPLLNKTLSVSKTYATPHFKMQKCMSPCEHCLVEGLKPYTMYEFSVLASDGRRNSSWSMMVWNKTHEAAPSSSPRDLTVIIDPDTPGQVVLTWQPPLEANGIITGYLVSYVTTSQDGQTMEEKVGVEGDKLSTTLNTLHPGVKYDFSVKARNKEGFGPPLWINNYHLPGNPAPVPATLTASSSAVDPTAVVLVWKIPQKVTTDILGFVILYTKNVMTGSTVDWEVESRPGHALRMAVIDGLDPNTAYHFKVQAHTSIGYGPESNIVLYTTPPVKANKNQRPVEGARNVQVNVLSATSAVVSWQDPGMARIYEKEDEEPLPPATYTVRYRAMDPVPSGWMELSQPFISLYLMDLEPLTQYEVMVRVRRQGKHSAWSEPVLNTTFAADFSQPPLTAEVQGRANSPDVAVLTWQPNIDSKIKEYVVMYTTDRWKLQKQWQQKAAVSDKIKQQTFHGLKPHTTYYFYVQAMTDLGFGPRSKVMSYTTPEDKKGGTRLKAPKLLKAKVMSSTSALVSWHDPGHSVDKISLGALGVPRTYTLRYRRSVPGATSDGSTEDYTMVWQSFPSVTVVNLVPGTDYEFQVRINRGFHHSDWSKMVLSTTLEEAPDSSPQNIKVGMAGDDPTSAIVTWASPEITNGNITGYQVYSGIKKGKLQPMLNVTGQQLSARVQSLEPKQSYHFSVKAHNRMGEGPLAEPVKYKTPRVIGDAPVNVSVRQAVNYPYAAVVNWLPTDVSLKGKRIKYYTVAYQTEERKNFTVNTVDGTQQETVLKMLRPSTTYHIQVQAHYKKGASPYSDVVGYSVRTQMRDTSK